MEWHIINTVEKEILRGRVKVPTGGRVRDPVLFLTLADPVKFRNRQYSLDERRNPHLLSSQSLMRDAIECAGFKPRTERFGVFLYAAAAEYGKRCLI